VIGIPPPFADPGVRTVEEEQPPDPFGAGARDPFSDVGAEVVADEPELVDTERSYEPHQIGGVILDPVSLGGRDVRPFRLAEPGQIRSDHVERVGEHWKVLAPRPPVLRPAVDQEQRKSGPLTDVVEFESVDPGVLVVPGPRSMVVG
jgi:hypothetical protein